MAPAAGGDGESGESGDGGDNFLGNFWDNLIETAPEEDAVESGDEIEDASAGEDLFSDDEAPLDDEFDIFTDDDDEEEEVFIGEEEEEEEDVFED